MGWLNMYDTPDDYANDRDARERCDDCQQTKEDFDWAADNMKSLLRCLYGNGPLNVVDFESHLEEICCVLNIKIPQNELKLIKG